MINFRKQLYRTSNLFSLSQRSGNICIRKLSQFYNAQIFNNICPKEPPCINDVINKEYIIIDDYDKTMRHPLINIDIKTNCETILYHEDCKSLDRAKPLYAIVSGMGRGKTRMLVEMDKYLKEFHGLDKDNNKSSISVISIPITFNRLWTTIITPTGNVNFDYAVAIVSRIISMYYNISLDNVHARFQVILKNLTNVNNDEDAKNLIRDCILYIVNQANRDKSNQTVTNFILMVDESKKVEKKFGTSEVHDILRAAVFDIELLKEDGSRVIVDLIMASLAINSTGVNSSGRTIVAFATPEYLDPTEVLDKWLSVYFSPVDYQLTDDDRLKLKCLIASISSIPRAIQIMTEQLANSLITVDNIKKIDHRVLYSNVVKKINTRYFFHLSNLPTKYAKALLFDDLIEIDDSIMSLIEESVLTNALTAIKEKSQIIPSASIIVMSNLDSKINKYAKPLIETIEQLNNDLHSLKGGIHRVGKPLEIIMNGLINARLYVLNQLALEEGKPMTCSIWDLLRLGNDDSALFIELEMNKIIFPSGRKQFSLSYSYDGGIDDFIDSANFFLDPNKIYHHIGLNLHAREFADGAWLFRLKNNKPFVLFIDCKSAMIKNISSKERTEDDSKRNFVLKDFTDLPGNGEQMLHLLEICKRIKERNIDINEGSVLDALNQSSYLYVYLNTREMEETFKVEGANGLQMGRSDSIRFLSYYKDYYLSTSLSNYLR